MSLYTSLISKFLTGFFIFITFSFFAQTIDSTEYYKVNQIKIIGNKKTKSRIILRELNKKKEDTLLLKNIDFITRRNEINVFNTQLFIYDSIICNINDSTKSIDYCVKVKERWYIWPIPSIGFLDRNINGWLQNRDFRRVNYGIALGLDNLTGVKDRLVFLIKLGYSNQFGLNYQLPYLNSQQTIGAFVQYVYSENNKINYLTTNNKQLFLTSETHSLRTDHVSKLAFFFRPKLFKQHTIELNHNYLSVTDSINKLNKDYFFRDLTTTQFFSLLYKFRYDDRDNKAYPLSGNMAELMLLKDGLDVSDKSHLNNAHIVFSFKKHIPISHKINFASQIRTRLVNTPQKIPFSFNRALGYDTYLRGYEFYVIDGQNYFITKSSLRYQLVKPRFKELKFLKRVKPFSTFPFSAYLNLFYDGGYVQETIYNQNNDLTNKWQHGYGLGLDFITYYDFVMRFEFSTNKQKQSGFFIHFTSGF